MRGARGYAEAGSVAPISTATMRAAKLAILCALAFGLRVDPAQIDAARRPRSITPPTSRERGARGGDDPSDRARRLRPRALDADRVGRADRSSPRGSIFARTTGPQNAALITGAHSGEIGIFGAGAGGDADGRRGAQRHRRHRARPRGHRARAGPHCRFQIRAASDFRLDFD